MRVDHSVPGVEEEGWCSERRAEALDFLRTASVTHGRIGEVPAMHVFPYISVWAVESVQAPGWVGWWVICGDCPTDYASCTGDRSPRAAVREFAIRWRAVSQSLAQGIQHPDFIVGQTASAKELAPLLLARARSLEQFAADDDIWPA